MKIGVDIKALRHPQAGIGRYITQLLDAIQKTDLKNEFILFSPVPINYLIKNPRWKTIICPGKIKLPGILWQQLVLPYFVKKENLDVFWGPEQTTFLLPISKVKKITTIYDFVYKRYAKTMRWSVRHIQKWFGEKSLFSSDRLVCISDFTAKEMQFFYPQIPPSKTGIVSCGYFAEETSSPLSEREPFLLFAGSLEPRKNLIKLIQALELLHEKGIDVPLYLTGPSGWKNLALNSILKNSPIKKSIIHLGYVSNKELKDLYRRCRALIFPSLYEGFGLPVLEALAFNTPVLTSSHSVMQEIAGPCAIYFDPKSKKSIAQAIENFWFSKALSTFTEEQEKVRMQILNKYTWENAALEMLNQILLSKRAK